MVTKGAEEIYEQRIKSLPTVDRLRSVELIAQGLASTVGRETSQSRSSLALEGLGKEIWQGIDAQDYVNEIRKEWDQRLS